MNVGIVLTLRSFPINNTYLPLSQNTKWKNNDPLPASWTSYCRSCFTVSSRLILHGPAEDAMRDLFVKSHWPRLAADFPPMGKPGYWTWANSVWFIQQHFTIDLDYTGCQITLRKYKKYTSMHQLFQKLLFWRHPDTKGNWFGAQCFQRFHHSFFGVEQLKMFDK